MGNCCFKAESITEEETPLLTNEIIQQDVISTPLNTKMSAIISRTSKAMIDISSIRVLDRQQLQQFNNCIAEFTLL
jgi:hypothetical protein